ALSCNRGSARAPMADVQFNSASSAFQSGEAIFTLDVGGNPLRVVRFTGKESISGPFEFWIEVAGNDLDSESLLGSPALLTIEGAETPRLVHGIVYEAEYVGRTRDLELYELRLGPQ